MRRSVVIIALLLGCVSMQAQEDSFWQKVNRFLTKPAVVDTTWIYQPKAALALGLFTTGQKANFGVDVDFDVHLDDGKLLEGVSSYSLNENLCKKIGLEVGYGNVGFGYSIEVGHKSAQKKRAFAFNVMGKSWGVRLNYYRITNPFTSGITIGTEGDKDYIHEEFVSKEMASLQNFTIDGYYVFNNKRFVYPAAYKMCLVQRRTSGSWMLAARYMQGYLYNSPAAAMDSYNLLDCFATLQASIGGGYSVNFVLWHKDPVGPRDEKLRNITVNLTAMPMLTALNFLKTQSYRYNDGGGFIGEKVSRVWCHPVPNFIGSAAASIALGRIYFSTQFTYNRFYFRSRDAFDGSQMDLPDSVDGISFTGAFRDWMLKGLLVYRF